MRNLTTCLLGTALAAAGFAPALAQDNAVTIVLSEELDVVEPCMVSRSNIGRVILQNISETMTELVPGSGLQPRLADFDADGRDELLIDNSIRELDGGEGVPLELIPDARYMVLDNLFGGKVVAWNFGGRPVLVAMVDERCMWSDSLGIWDMQGRLLYCERFGEKLHSIAVVRDGGRQRLAVLTQSRLLISP